MQGNPDRDPHRGGTGSVGRARTAAESPFCAAESLVMYALRAWTEAAANPPGSTRAQAGAQRWKDAFGHIAAETAEPLDQILLLLARKTRRKIHTGCPCCGRASIDEVRLLAYLGACRHRMDALAGELLGYWLEARWHPLAAQYGREFVLYLASSGYELPAPSPGRLKRIAVESLIQTSEIRVNAQLRETVAGMH